MKQLILILLLSYCFCKSQTLRHMIKYDSIEIHEEIGIIYLDIEEFEKGDTIHMLFDAVNGYMSNTLYFEFNDEEPNINKTSFAHSMEPSMTSTSEVQTISDYRETQSYYYDIEKEKNTKYLVMKYTGFRGEYLKVENNRANWALVIIICVVGGFLLIFLIILGGFIFYRIKQKRRNTRNVVDYNQNLSQPTETPYQQNTNTNGVFYAPPPPPGFNSNI